MPTQVTVGIYDRNQLEFLSSTAWRLGRRGHCHWRGDRRRHLPHAGHSGRTHRLWPTFAGVVGYRWPADPGGCALLRRTRRATTAGGWHLHLPARGLWSVAGLFVRLDHGADQLPRERGRGGHHLCRLRMPCRRLAGLMDQADGSGRDRIYRRREIFSASARAPGCRTCSRCSSWRRSPC
jgi:hypothetical protein